MGVKMQGSREQEGKNVREQGAHIINLGSRGLHMSLNAWPFKFRHLKRRFWAPRPQSHICVGIIT